MFDELADLAGRSPLTYLIIVGLVALDAIIPVAPSETLVVTGGVLASSGGLMLPLVGLAAFGGALSGHTILYFLGRYTGPGIRRRMFKGEQGRARLERAATMLRERTWLLIVSDFIPIGRTAAMFAAGALGLPARRFFGYVVPGTLLWATVYTLLGYLGGSTFEREWQALLVSIGVALAVAASAEAVQRLRRD